jgi:ATP-binding cassette subfamily B (MDR/TAP) protein 8
MKTHFKNFPQVIGSACAVYKISPEMTGLMLVVVPAVIAVGTFFGSFLRVISKMAQAQVCSSCHIS